MRHLLTTREVAKYLRLRQETVLRKTKRGELPAIKIGKQFRFDKDEIDKWLLHHAVGSTANILVIDDEPVIGQLFKDTLQENSYQVTTTTSSSEGLELFNKKQFDLIFLDLKMPELDGAELFRHIRETNKQVPVVIITGYPDSELMEKAMEHGSILVMKKPFSSDAILNAVHSFAKTVTAKG
jgi:excisionase family DNA binding protein